MVTVCQASWHNCFTCTQILKEDDTFWPQPDKVGRQVSGMSTF